MRKRLSQLVADVRPLARLFDCSDGRGRNEVEGLADSPLQFGFHRARHVMAKPPKKSLTERLNSIGRDGSNQPVSRARRAEEVGEAVLRDQYPDVDWSLKDSEKSPGPDAIGFANDQPYTAEVKAGRTRSANPTAQLSNTVHGRQGSAEYTHAWLRRDKRK